MALRVSSVDIQTFETPLKRPFVTALGRKAATTNVGIAIRLSDGGRGYGEASTSLAMAHLSPAALSRGLARAARAAIGREVGCPGKLIKDVWARLEDASPAAAAFESALLTAVADGRGLTLSGWFGGALTHVDSDITISACGPQASAEAVREAAGEGFRAFKIKVGGSFDDDLARVRAARSACPRAKVLLDGNQGLTPRGAMKLVEACLQDGPIELLEQPLPRHDIALMPALSRRCPVPIVLDESVATPEQAVRAADRRACSGFNIKAAKSGLLRSLEIAAVARAAGLKLMIGCMAETAAGLSPSVHLALGTGYFTWVDLDSDHLLASGGPGSHWSRQGPRLSGIG